MCKGINNLRIELILVYIYLFQRKPQKQNRILIDKNKSVSKENS